MAYDEQDIMFNMGVILPIWTGNNQEMFSKYVYTELSDIEETKINLNALFRNKKLGNYIHLYSITLVKGCKRILY